MAQSMGHTTWSQILYYWPTWFCKQCEANIEQKTYTYRPANSNQCFYLWEMGNDISLKHFWGKLHQLGLSMSPQLAITTLNAMESTSVTCFIVLLPNKKVFNTPVFQIWTYFKVGCEILTVCPFVMDFNQPFNNYNIRSRNHKDGSIVSYQLLFTKPRASNVFDNIVTRLFILYILANYMYCTKNSR
jgi:hypothetical protein